MEQRIMMEVSDKQKGFVKKLKCVFNEQEYIDIMRSVGIMGQEPTTFHEAHKLILALVDKAIKKVD